MPSIFAVKVFVVGIALALCSNVNVQAQTVIEPGPPGTINEAILGDTTATGERNSCHYVLQRGEVYIYNQRMALRADCEWIIEAEDGDGPRPIIRPAALPGGEESPRPFHLFASTTLTIRNLYLDGYDTSLPDPGRPGDNATIRIGADAARLILDGVRIDRNRQSAIRTDNEMAKVYVMNSQFSNVYNDTRPDQSYIFDTRGNDADSVVFINNTIWNHTGEPVNTFGGESEFNYIKFDHNTFVNIGGVPNEPARLDTLRAEEPGEQNYGVIDLSQAEYAVFRNNLMVNTGVIGTEDNDVFVPRFVVNIDSSLIEIDSVTFDMEAPAGVDIRNNVYAFDDNITTGYPDTIRAYTDDEIYDPTLDLFIEAQGSAGTLISADVALNSAPGVDPQWVVDFYDFAVGVREREVLLFERDTRQPDGEGDLDFGYPESSTAYTAGVDGMPVGDLNWFDMADGYESGPDQFATIGTSNESTPELPDGFTLRGNYPNPFNPTTTIQFDLQAAANVSVAIYDILGRKVREMAPQSMAPGYGHAITFDANELASGTYFYTVRAEMANEVVTKTGRMVLIK